MKSFFKTVFATMVGMLFFTILAGFIGIMCIIGMVASSNATKNVKDNSVFVLNLSGSLDERSESNFIDQFTGTVGNVIGLDDVLDAIKKAEENDKIKGIYIEAGLFLPDSYASLQAIRKALTDFKKSGKWIIAYGDTYTQATYYLASVADKVYLNPQGQIDWGGVAMQAFYLKDFMAKFGVKMQLAKVGNYKSAPEMFTADKMGELDREQRTAFVNGVWENVCKDVSGSRKISVDSLNAYADKLITFDPAENYKKYKMVDDLLYTDQVKKEVKKLLEIDEDEDIRQLGVADMMNVKSKKRKGEEIAVYYAYGDIVDGEGQSMLSNGHVIDAQIVCKDLERLMNDDDVKAVVIRVNSGGGSAYASEQIWHQVEMLKRTKPVVVSMGGMAASGGYYMSCIANWIVAEPTTLTGSIGIFGMFPDMSELLTDKLGVKFDEVKTNKHSTFGTRARPFNAEEMAYLEKYIDRGYKLFRSRVATGRKMSEDEVEKIAQGHVWIGQDALKIKLVDELGGLDVAVKKAAQLAKLEEYYTYSYPSVKTWWEQLGAEVAGKNYLDERMKALMGEYYRPFMLLKTINQQNTIQARIPFAISIK